jgi:O-antigen/teichoic acid export membrane protein
VIKIKSSEFVKNVLTLLTGTALGQVVMVLFAVVISRLYSPEDFATLEQFAMIVGILGVVAGGRYEAAVMLPKADDEARTVVHLTLLIAAILAILLLVVTALGATEIAHAFGNPGLEPALIWIGPTIFLFVLTTSLGYWFSRSKSYRNVAASKTAAPLVSEPAKVAFAATAFKPMGLIFGVVLGHITAAFWLTLNARKKTPLLFRRSAWHEVQTAAIQFAEYPRYSIAGSLLNMSAQWLHIALFTFFYGDQGLITIGFLALARRIIMTPLSMLATSFSQVYYQRLAHAQSDGDIQSDYLRSLKRMILPGVALIVFVWLLPAQTTAFVFGDAWREVLGYLRILIFWFVANAIGTALAFTLHRIRAQKLILKLDIIHFVVIIVALFSAYAAGCSPIQALVVFVATKVIYIAFNMRMTWMALKRFNTTTA